MRSWTISISTDSRVPGMARGTARLCWIKRMSLGIAACLWCFLSTPTLAQDASARSERDRLVAFFAERFPSVPLDDYIYGALIGNPGGRRQYDEIMELPPFLGDLEGGQKSWETPFRNGRTFGVCFRSRGGNVVGHDRYYDEKLGGVGAVENGLNACLTAKNAAR